MTRLLVILISMWLLPLTLCAEDLKGVHELESDALSMWLLRDSDEATRRSIAKAMTGEVEPDQATLDQALKQLDEKLAQVDSDDRFILSRVVGWQEWDKLAEQFTLKPALPVNNKMLRNPFFPSIKTGSLPGFLTLVLPNYRMTHTMPMKSGEASTFLDSRRDQSDFHRQRLFVEIHLKPEAFQQGQYVQMVIEKIDVFDHKTTRNLITTLHEKRKPSTVLADSLLSNGVTSQAVPVHNFTIHGIRMQEMLVENHPFLGTCTRTSSTRDELPHRLIRCHSKQSFKGIQYDQRLDYIGGRLDTIHLSTDAAPDEETLARWQFSASREFGLPLQADKPVSWKKFSIQLSYDPQALIRGDKNTPFLVAKGTQSHDGN